MRILVVNPNTTVEMTKQIERTLNAVKRADTVLEVMNPAVGSAGLESAYDELVSGLEMLKIVQAGRAKGYDALVIACFSDPAVIAAKEILDVPVVGIAEAAMHMACMIGRKFSIVVTFRHRVPGKELYVVNNGLEGRLASVRGLGLSVVETSSEPEKTKEAILSLARTAIDEDGAEVIILGCAGMSGYARELEQKLGVPVLDPVPVALKMAEVMVDLGLKPSKIGLFARPKQFGG